MIAPSAGANHPTSANPRHPGPRRSLLCPDRGTLDRFLVRFLSFFSFQRYPAAATFKFVPAWLRFLESRGLIDAEQRSQTLSELRGLATDLRVVWEKHTADPALDLGIERWRENAGLS